MARCRSARLLHGHYSHEVKAVRREVKELVGEIRCAIELAEMAMFNAPQPTDIRSARERLRIEREIGRNLHELFEEIGPLFLAGISQPLDEASYTNSCVAVAKSAAWARLGPAFRELGKAMVIGPPHAKFSRW